MYPLGQVALGVTGLDVAADIRDISHDLANWEWTWEHAGQTTLDGIGLLPVVGAIKYGDEAASLLKNGENIASTGTDIASTAGKNGNSLVDAGQGSGVGNYLKEPATQNGTLNIGAGSRPTDGAYNIDIDPKVSGVNSGNMTNFSKIKTGSQSKIIIDNPYDYDPLNPEVLRVLSQDGEIVLTGSRSNIEKNQWLKNLDEKGLTIKERSEVLNDGSYKTTDGQPIKSKKLDRYVIVKK
ncbi:hypothetical protein [Acetonema longum]|uniref:Uncharacterized protein n=1 Tax=Acetonema longum DSM 6540 TaxID=1009370 RepID=F7NMP3_9FIRM|nr:hypothetical protein [Acetonema longum]EGO62689.1 hypothetical protein ALO_16871 [Acetonema longum DSM 6540]